MQCFFTIFEDFDGSFLMKNISYIRQHLIILFNVFWKREFNRDWLFIATVTLFFYICLFIWIVCLHSRKPLAQLRSAIDHIMMLHNKLVDVGGLHPDSEDELNLPISSTDKRASWSRTRSLSVTRTRYNSTSSVTSAYSGFKVLVLFLSISIF